MSDLSVTSGRNLFSMNRPENQPKAEKVNQGPSFAERMKDSIAEVEAKQFAADQAIEDVAVGRRKNLHETMIAIEQADISFRMLMAVRGKVMAAYQEISRMSF